MLDVPSLSLIAAATRVRVAPKTIKVWHYAGLLPAVQVGSRGKAWKFDEATFDRKVAALPRCAYSGGCDRPVARSGDPCRDHRLAAEGLGKPRSPEIVEKVARSLRKYQDGDYFCEVDGCENELRERKGWRIAQRKAKSEDGVVRCGSCAAKRRHELHPIYADAKSTAQEHELIVGLAEIAAALPRELRRSPAAVLGHIRSGALPALRDGWLHTMPKAQMPVYVEWLLNHPDGRLRHFNATSVDLARARGAWYQARHNSGDEFGRLATIINKAGPKPKLAHDEEEKIHELRARGHSQQRIANAVGVSRKQVRGVLERAELGA